MYDKLFEATMEVNKEIKDAVSALRTVIRKYADKGSKQEMINALNGIEKDLKAMVKSANKKVNESAINEGASVRINYSSGAGFKGIDTKNGIITGEGLAISEITYDEAKNLPKAKEYTYGEYVIVSIEGEPMAYDRYDGEWYDGYPSEHYVFFKDYDDSGNEGLINIGAIYDCGGSAQISDIIPYRKLDAIVKDERALNNI